MAQDASSAAVQKPVALIPGDWEGEYLDAYGHRGQLRMTLEESDGSVKGSYELTIADEDQADIQRGEIVGSIERGVVGLSFGSEKGDIRVEHKAQIRHAGGYALQALVGVVDPVPGTGLGGGVWIAWRFGQSGELART